MQGGSLSDSELDGYLADLRRFKVLSENKLRRIVNTVKTILVEEPNVVHIKSPVVICGTICGQFPDLLEILYLGGKPDAEKYLFLGNYVNRGKYSVETFTYLLILKIKYPDRIVLLRGHQESSQITQVYGFYDECHRKYYGSMTAWKMFSEVFNLLNLAAIIDSKLFCVHGGIGPEIHTVDTIQAIPRNMETPYEGPMYDLLWSDPEDIDGWMITQSSWLYGQQPLHSFLARNGFCAMTRSHQLVMEGYRLMFENRHITLFSAPNYAGRCENVAAIMKVDGLLNCKFIPFLGEKARSPAQPCLLDGNKK